MKHSYQQEQIQSKALDKALIRRLWGYLGPFRFWVFLAILLLIISKGIEAYVPIAIGHLTQQILNNTQLSKENNNVLLSSILHSCFFIISLLVFSYLLDSINVVLRSWVGQKALYKLRTHVFQHIQEMPLRYFDRHTVGRLMTRTIHDVEQINQLFAESLIPLIGSLLLFICIAIGIIVIDWKLACVVAIIMPLVLWMTNRFRINQRRCYETIRTIVSAMNTFIQEHLMGASTIRSFGLAKKEKEHFEEINQDHCDVYVESIHHFSLFIASIDVFQSISLIMVFVFLVAFAPPETGFQAGTYFAFSLYALMFFRPLADLTERYNVLQSAMAAGERIFEVLDQTSEPKGPSHFIDIGEIESIEFNDVWFAYEKENWVLKGLTLNIKKGESVALVGITGAGKTSVMSLLLRFYEFQKGTIKVNGHDIREYPLAILRRLFSVVLQDPVIFSGTIEENISLYEPHLKSEEVESVISYLKMNEFIDRFPDKLQHQLTERGKTLSLGETQLISMARAVAHKRSVLLLDEATANIDIKTEKIIQEALEKILHNKTALVIAHRLSTIKDVSRIVVLHEGAVIETGTHQQLLKAKGYYEKLYRLQFEQ